MSTKFSDIGDFLIVEGIAAPTAAAATNFTGTGVDMSTVANNNCFAIQIVGAVVSGTSGQINGKIQEASTLTGTYADISGAVFTAVSQTTGTQIVDKINFQRTLPFVRYVGTITGTTPSLSLDVIFGGQKGQIGN